MLVNKGSHIQPDTPANPTPPSQRERFEICVGCGANVLDLGEFFYKVTDELWEQSGGGKGVLCIKCLETRIGRTLVPEDFPPVRINRQRSTRLRAKMYGVRRIEQENAELREQLQKAEHKCKSQQKTELQDRLLKAELKLKQQEQKYLRLLQQRSVQRYKTCGKKVTFPSKSVADTLAQQKGQRAYHCPHCSKWHLTTQVVREEKS
jgi:hypothetical protein